MIQTSGRHTIRRNRQAMSYNKYPKSDYLQLVQLSHVRQSTRFEHREAVSRDISAMEHKTDIVRKIKVDYSMSSFEQQQTNIDIDKTFVSPSKLNMTLSTIVDL